ncbi:hypothetical protein K458DRAFT_325445 [Lentithecium fluviatile CBS 122367]|uniref:SET domain-containing protein n=1 Tax=Lentithecium fluviatile CBS 122367 TaxID=1168545 RepID=A0A6G1JNV7_9PLEO|nr:hypothetical protein K458DRAFT_325445 [Lentithecium fluviatile CBS 122367]
MFRRQLDELLELQQRTLDRPYSVLHRLKLAKAYQDLGYPDLAVGDAYKALILIDEVVEEGEYHEQAVETALVDFGANSEPQHSHCFCQTASKETNTDDEERAGKLAKQCWSRTAYGILIPCLLECGCLKTAFDYGTRALKAFPHLEPFQTNQQGVINKLRSHFDSQHENFDAVDIQDYPDKGRVRRELYPWNNHEPDRFSPDVLQLLNDELESIAPKLEVKVAKLPVLSVPSSLAAKSRHQKQLGMFAKEDISPGEQILQEKSLLAAVSRLHEFFCDACSIPLPDTKDVSNQTDAQTAIIVCDECNEVFFCSEECHGLAQENYHPSLCGINIDQKVSASEAPDALYTLLVIRAMAMAETQDMHPLELKEVRYIWGDYHGLDVDELWDPEADAFGGLPRTLPFSFDANVLRPLHILEKMDVNIFEQSHRYDTWIFNTLYAKLRGTASARQGLDGRPETGAVHPKWCLANHSCDPNVAWEWQGTMRFWAREKLVDWKGRDPGIEPGLKKGAELLSHYCDVRLSVKERREWAAGALGGVCICPRCVWEDAEMQRQGEAAQ